jgi:proliferating cell nuclear antigen PCNA
MYEAARNKFSSKTPNYILEIQSLQVGPLKAMIEALKEIIKEGTFECSPVTYGPDGTITQQSGITLEAMNKATTIFVKLNLPADNFDHYYVGSTKPILINVNMQSLYKLFKTINNDDQMITLFLERGNMNELGITIDNTQKNKRTTYKLSMLELQSDPYKSTLNEPVYNVEICISSTDFHKIIRDLTYVCDQVNITFIDEPNHRNTLVFYGKGEIASQKTELSALPGKSDEEFYDIESIMITGQYNLKNLSLFAKWAPLCAAVKIYMRQEYPSIFIYQIANVGTAKLVVASKVEDNNNDDKEYDDDEQDVDIGE